MKPVFALRAPQMVRGVFASIDRRLWSSAGTPNHTVDMGGPRQTVASGG